MRYVLGNDIITRIPRLNYTHVGGERHLGNPSSTSYIRRYIGDIRDHFIDSYIHALNGDANDDGDGDELDRPLLT